MAQFNPILIAYDGDCLMCSSGMNWLAVHDKYDRLRFAPLDSPVGHQLARELDGPVPDSILVKDQRGVQVKSTAVITILRQLGSPWSMLARLAQCLTPRGVRDALYDWIARRRRRASPDAQCPLPNEALSKRLIHRTESLDRTTAPPP